MFQGMRSAAKARHAGDPDGKGGDEAAAKDEGHDRCDKKNQIKEAEWTRTTVGGSVICWLRIARKRGFVLNGRVQCDDDTIGCVKL